MSVREKNLLLVTEAADIFGFTRGVTWDDLRKEISADQVRELYEVVGALWPAGIDVTEYLPEPGSRLRALYLGDIHPQKLARNVTRFGLYADEILIIDQLRSPWAFSEEYNPILHPRDLEGGHAQGRLFPLFPGPVGTGRPRSNHPESGRLRRENPRGDMASR